MALNSDKQVYMLDNVGNNIIILKSTVDCENLVKFIELKWNSNEPIAMKEVWHYQDNDRLAYIN